MTIHHDRRLPSYSLARQFTSLQDVPLDIVHLIADHSSARDLIALSTVSKPLQDLMSDPGIWRKLYKKSLLLLPAGPYEWQSNSYLANALSRAEKLHAVWPSSSSRPEILHTRSISFGCDATLSVLLGRWLLVADGSSLVCYDSQYRNIQDSSNTLFDDDAGRRIVRVFSVGSVRKEGAVAFAVLLFEDSYIITKVLLDGGKPSSICTVLTSTTIPVEGWTDLVHVRLYDRFLVMNICECWNDWDPSEHLIIMDIDTMRRYYIPASTPDAKFHLTLTTTFFFATQTHLVRIRECSIRSKVRFEMECFPLPAAHQTPESDTLYPSHRSRIIHGPKLRDFVVIHDSPVDLETGRKSFALCGLNIFSDGGRLEVVEVFLERDASIAFMGSGFDKCLVKSFCLGSSRQHACGVALGMDDQPLAFALNYYGSGSVTFKYSTLDRKFSASELLPLGDAFAGTVFFSRRSSQDTSVKMIDFIRDARKMEGCLPDCVPENELKFVCDCGECYLSF